MHRSKKIFAGFALAFLLIVAYLAYDISSRTTFPGGGSGTEEHTEQPVVDSGRHVLPSDSAK